MFACSQGKYLNYKGLKKNYSPSKRYSSDPKDCSNCPLKVSCIGKSNQKMITETLSKPLFDQMAIRTESRTGKKMRRARQSTVEPVIGTLVNFLGLKKLKTKGLSKATKSMTVAAIAYNLKKLIKFKPNEIESQWATITKEIQRLNTGQNYLLGFKVPHRV